VPSPTNNRGHNGKVLCGCTTAFFPLYKNIKSCIKILLPLSDMVRTKGQMLFQMFERVFLPLKECWNTHQNWPTNGDNIAIWMNNPLVCQSFIQVQDSERDKQKKQKLPTFLSQAAMRIYTKLCMKRMSVPFLHPLDFFNQTSNF